jgi:hypothetical protein
MAVAKKGNPKIYIGCDTIYIAMNPEISALNWAVDASKKEAFVFGEESAYPSFEAFMTEAYSQILVAVTNEDLLGDEAGESILNTLSHYFASLNTESRDANAIAQLQLVKTLLFFYVIYIHQDKKIRMEQDKLKNMMNALPKEDDLALAVTYNLKRDSEVTGVLLRAIMLGKTLRPQVGKG